MGDISCDDCPRSILDERLIWIVDQESRARLAREGGGGVMYGTDASKWPAAWFDAITAIEVARIQEHNARVKAEMSERH